MAYSLFGYGSKTGALGIEDTAGFWPEVGVLGLGLNVLFVAALWRSLETRLRSRTISS